MSYATTIFLMSKGLRGVKDKLRMLRSHRYFQGAIATIFLIYGVYAVISAHSQIRILWGTFWIIVGILGVRHQFIIRDSSDSGD